MGHNMKSLWRWLAKVYKRIVVVAVLLLIAACICVLLSERYYPSMSLSLNRKLWNNSRPSEYYMQVHAWNVGWVTWEVYVRNGNVVKVNTLKTDQHARLPDPTTLTIEQIFDWAARYCVGRGFLDCGLEFDSGFHYPKSVLAYEAFYIGVEQFVPCEQAPEICSPVMKPP